ncbi:AraC family transcriptional regulator [Variovorax sp. JS1663]|uniref:AraC family transcriptional regulator n=1 Tax=Variovorax sp. JS1663 TaxID=1851577 RepID=UPI00307B24D6
MAAIVALLRPRTVLSKFVSGAGSWAVQYPNYGHPSFALMLEGACWLSVESAEPFLMEAGDYVLLPATPGFRMGSDLDALERPTLRVAEATPVGEVRHGIQEDEAAVRMLGGYFLFDPTNAPLLVGLLPTVVHIKANDPGAERLTWIARAIGEESTTPRAGGDAILTRLVEVMLIEAMRWRPAPVHDAAPLAGLLAGLADARMSKALRLIHEDVSRRWTIEALGDAVGMSRAAFAARFMQVLGVPPMEYVLRWRMALAKDMLWHDGLSLGEVAHGIGYQSASAFSAAFSRSVGVSPSAFARADRTTASGDRPVPVEASLTTNNEMGA